MVSMVEKSVKVWVYVTKDNGCYLVGNGESTVCFKQG